MRAVFRKFFADRGTHLAAMIAYFALLSFVPLLFLALAFLGLAGRADESSLLVHELERVLPGSSVSGIVTVVDTIQKHAATLGVIGGVALFWTSLSLFSVLESAFNIVYGKQNRKFLRGKALAVLFMLTSLITLFIGLLVASFGYGLLKRHVGFVAHHGWVGYTLSIVVSLITVFFFLVSAYHELTNEDVTVREVLPGAIVATFALEASFQALPVYLRLSKQVPALQAFGGPVILLVWLYVMANLIVFGAEINWWRVRRGELAEATQPRERDVSSRASTRLRALRRLPFLRRG